MVEVGENLSERRCPGCSICGENEGDTSLRKIQRNRKCLGAPLSFGFLAVENQELCHLVSELSHLPRLQRACNTILPLPPLVRAGAPTLTLLHQILDVVRNTARDFWDSRMGEK